MEKVKIISISFVSALLGGALVLGVLKFKPDLLLVKKVEEGSPSHTSEFHSLEREKDLFDNITKQQKQMKRQFDLFFDDDFFGQNDPFDSMRKFREKMEEETGKFGGGTIGPFDSWFDYKFGGGSVDDIEKREDDDFVYYDIKVKDLNSTTLNTKVENGYITITGNIEKKSSLGDDQATGTSIFSTSFSRTFPLPSNVDESKMEMIPDGDKIVLKFPKQKI